MNLLKFTLATALGSLLWTGLLAYAGFILGANFAQIGDYIGPVSNAVIAGIVVVYVWRVFHHKGEQGPGKAD
jgi:membrane protein DedA with SNARE-associated domain